MTTDDDTNDPREREWRLQEQARIDQKLGAATDGSARALRYRLVARGLDRPLDAALPSNFSHAQAQCIEAIAIERRRADARFVRRLKLGFALGYGGCVATAAMAYRAELVAWLDAPVIAGVAASPWWPLLFGCASLAYLLHRRPWRSIASRR
jgi:hypothetical protein